MVQATKLEAREPGNLRSPKPSHARATPDLPLSPECTERIILQIIVVVDPPNFRNYLGLGFRV